MDRVEGIDRMQPSSEVRKFDTNKKIEREKSEIEEKQESVDRNQLSADELQDELEDKIEDMNNILETLEENLSFKLHDETERLMVQVIDIKTKEVLKEMPPEEMLDLAARIHRMVGVIIDEEV